MSVELVLVLEGAVLVLERLMPEESVADISVPGAPWFELAPQFPVGIPHPLPPAMGHHFGSGSVGDQSVIGVST